MKWLKNLESIATTKTSGNCPFCNSEDTDYSFVGKVSTIGYGVIWCNSCKRAYTISRMQIVDGYKLNKSIPQELVYES